MLSIVEKVLFLKSIDLFSKIPGQDLALVAAIAEEVVFDKGETLMREGEMGNSLYIIVFGKVKVHKGSNEISELVSKDCVGELAILDSEPRSASVTVIEEVTALKIEREDFYELLSEKIEIAQGIMKVLAHRLRQAISQ